MAEGELPEFGGAVVRVPLLRLGVGIHGEPLRSSLPGDDALLPPLTADDPRFGSGIDVVEVPRG